MSSRSIDLVIVKLCTAYHTAVYLCLLRNSFSNVWNWPGLSICYATIFALRCCRCHGFTDYILCCMFSKLCSFRVSDSTFLNKNVMLVKMIYVCSGACDSGTKTQTALNRPHILILKNRSVELEKKPVYSWRVASWVITCNFIAHWFFCWFRLNVLAKWAVAA